MEAKYRKIICPNGHESRPVSMNQTLPRRCETCGQLYLKTTKPIWCDAEGRTISEMTSEKIPEDEKKDLEVDGGGRNRRRRLLEEEPVQPSVIHRRRRQGVQPAVDEASAEEKETEIINGMNQPGQHEEAERIGMMAEETEIVLQNGAATIPLTGEGILGREHEGKELFSVNRLISRSHCRYIVTQTKGLQISDAGSLNGTFVDTGEGRIAIGVNEKVYVRPGDRLWLADMLFEIKEG